MNSYGKFKRSGQGGSNTYSKVMYDIRDNVESQAERIVRLSKSIKQLSSDIKDIKDMLEERNDISRIKSKRKYTLPYGSSDKEQTEVLQGCSTKDEGTRICKSQIRRGCRVVDLHEQGQAVDGRSVANTVAFDVSPPRQRSDIESEPE